MSYGPTQDRVGNLRKDSRNPVSRTGRSDGTATPATGKTEHGKSTNPVSRKGSEPGRLTQTKVGVQRTGRGDLPGPDATRIDDKISGV